jgi:hypothetical protein
VLFKLEVRKVVGFGEKVKGFFVSPVSTFQEVKDETMGSAVKYFAILTVPFGILFAIIFAVIGAIIGGFFGGGAGAFFGGVVGAASGIALIPIIIIVFIIGLFIGAAILHIFVYLVGGRKGYTQTLKATAYGATPMLLLGWIVPLLPIFIIWALIVQILGIRELHEISTGRAVLAVLLPAIIGAVIVGIYIVIVGFPTPQTT